MHEARFSSEAVRTILKTKWEKPRILSLTPKAPFPLGAPIYFFRYIFHNWSTSACNDIFLNTIPAMDRSSSRIVIYDVLLQSSNPGSMEAFLDVQMMAHGETKRIEPQWHDMLTGIGLVMERFECGLEGSLVSYRLTEAKLEQGEWGVRRSGLVRLNMATEHETPLMNSMDFPRLGYSGLDLNHATSTGRSAREMRTHSCYYSRNLIHELVNRQQMSFKARRSCLF